MPRIGKTGSVSEVLRSDREVSLEWRIPGFLDLAGGQAWYISPAFPLGGATWHLRLWPDIEEGRVDLQLLRECSGPSALTADVAVAVKGSGGEARRRWEFGQGTFCGFDALAQRKELIKQGLLPGGAMTITCEVRLPAHTPSTDPTSKETKGYQKK